MGILGDAVGAVTGGVAGEIAKGANAAGFDAAAQEANEAKMIGNVMVQMLNQTAKQSQDDGTGGS